MSKLIDLDGLNEFKTQMFNAIYPVGSFFQTTSSDFDTVEKVAAHFGGTWEKIEGKFLLAANSSYTNNSTGGSATHSHLLEGYAKMTSSDTNLRWKYKDTSYYDTNWQLTVTSSSSTASTAHDGIELGGSTEVKSNMPPYLAVYTYRRTA